MNSTQVTSLAKEVLETTTESPVQPQAFKTVDAFTTFAAEYTTKDSDIVLHFFMTNEVWSQGWRKRYWDTVFPQILDEVARSYFRAEYPRLKAQQVDGVLRATELPTEAGVTSWWFSAANFAQVPDVDGLVAGFLEKLDQALDKAMETMPGWK
jgi:hypothetical protein